MKPKHKFLLSLLALSLVTGSLGACGKKDGEKEAGSKVEATKQTSETEKAGSDEAKKPEETSESEPQEEVREQSSYKLFPMKFDEIDVYAKKKKPEKRKYEWNWDHKLFYRIEGLKLGGKLIREDNGKKALTLKDFKIRRKVLKNKKTGNRMEYEIYTHPKTKKINKIVSIEYRKNDLELTDYYYTNDGKPNFIFVRKDSIYTPRFADTDIPGYRYYFNKDYLLKWRWVDKPFDVKERALKSHRSEAKPQYLYQNSSKKEKKAFDKEEVKMLNAAYNTLAAMKEKSEHGRLHGYVVDKVGQPVKGAKVEILENGKLVGELTTNEKGLYETGIMENKDGYDLKISADGFGEVEVKGVKVTETDEVILVEVIVLVKATDTESKVSLSLFDAEKTKEENKKYKRTPLKKAKVVVRKGMENRSGDIVLETTGNEKGEADFNLPNGIYTVEIIMDGYVTAYRSLVVEGDVKESLPLVKKPKKKGMKIVVNWEGDADLDSTLFTPNEGVEGEVFYVGSGRKKEGKTKLLLDGKKDYTTEVITIDDASKGNFKYYVSDYTRARKKDYTSKDMKKLKIIVYVYDENGLVAIYTLPYDVNGIIWESL